MMANILPADPPLTLGVGSKCQNSPFSDYGHVAYQIKWNRECRPSPSPPPPRFYTDMSDNSHEITSSCAKLLGSFFKSDVNSKSRLTILFSVNDFFLSINFTFVLGAQKNRLMETVLLSTRNICFC